MLAVALLSALKRVEADSRMSPDPLQSKLFPLTKLNSVSLGYSWNHNHLDVLADLLVEFSKVFDPILAFYFEVGFHTFVSAFSADNNHGSVLLLSGSLLSDLLSCNQTWAGRVHRKTAPAPHLAA
jgi:hypothetical protein